MLRIIIIVTTQNMFVSFYLSCTGFEASRVDERGESSDQVGAANQHMHPVKRSNQDRQTLDKQARPVKMATGTLDFLCQQLERRCPEVSLHCIKHCILAV